ncbi:MAG TPA: hypothetical protein DDX39_01975 [Bacteroidales bacterium]|nr:MAG: hypothetical protein A2W98_08595 [Bacteroidetes bacterium GWF2_33_38]OFY74101.1 MAG: hypothetical protein A2265_10190 [Bacteroidetes bacterium RIFOXYA12_FULL_33_9]OFY90277.1 MAG: hypothetical protein A2236_04395 [Bacteroidetes bacterium RIFOXYA2_FULL_33_7]HBF87381.1 hypothetical protein [Bacteroidales bacterium]
MATKKVETSKKEVKKVEKETSTKKASPKTTKKDVSTEEIAKRAFEIHVETGNHDELENWTQAEKELKGKKK